MRLSRIRKFKIITKSTESGNSVLCFSHIYTKKENGIVLSYFILAQKIYNVNKNNCNTINIIVMRCVKLIVIHLY